MVKRDPHRAASEPRPAGGARGPGSPERGRAGRALSAAGRAIPCTARRYRRGARSPRAQRYRLGVSEGAVLDGLGRALGPDVAGAGAMPRAAGFRGLPTRPVPQAGSASSGAGWPLPREAMPWEAPTLWARKAATGVGARRPSAAKQLRLLGKNQGIGRPQVWTNTRIPVASVDGKAHTPGRTRRRRQTMTGGRNLAHCTEDLDRAGISAPHETRPAGNGDGRPAPYDRFDYLAFLCAKMMSKKIFEFKFSKKADTLAIFSLARW